MLGILRTVSLVYWSEEKDYSNTLLMESDVAFPASFNTCGFSRFLRYFF
jgi:hypothetical protein